MLPTEKRGTVRDFTASRDERAARGKSMPKTANENERVNYVGLRQRVMSRFAKTLARLAK